MRAENDENELSSFKIRKVAAVSLFVLVLAAGLSACREQEAVVEPIRPVKAIVVEHAKPERYVTYSGVIAPRIETTLGFRVGGKVVERLVDVGDTVTKGQPVARLDDTDLKLSENSARANVNSARTRLAVAQDALDRAKSLAPKGFIAQSVVDQRQLEADSAKAALDAAQDQFEQARNASGYALLLADRNGIVTDVRAEPGQVVAVGQAVITLAQAGEQEVSVAVPENEVTELTIGQQAEVALWAAPDIRSSASIREIAGAADPASRTYAVRVALANPSPMVRLGMTATVTFRLAHRAPGFAIPLAALSEREGQKNVFVADAASGVVSSRTIQIAGVSENAVRVSEGLNPGDVVVTGGVQFLREGMKVRLPADLAIIAAAHRVAGH